jgi:hypothetical protein
MKKSYRRPLLVRRENLVQVAAVNGNGPIVIISLTVSEN